MTDCSLITECIPCITSVLQCFFVLTGTGNAEKWHCVPSLAGMRDVRMTVMDVTREFCPPLIPSTTGTGNEIVTYLSFALALFCLIGICVMAYWARKDRQRRRTSPPPRPPPPNPAFSVRTPLSSLTTFARRRQEERLRTRAVFDRRNAEFQRELEERLERVRAERAAAYPDTPRNTPDPTHHIPTTSRQSSQPPPSIPSSQSQTRHPPRSASVDPPSRGSSNWSSRTSTPLSRQQTPTIPEINSSTSSSLSEHVYDSPTGTIYESLVNSPQPSPPIIPPIIPPHQNLLEPANEPALPSEPRSRAGRLLKQTSFFKCNP